MTSTVNDKEAEALVATIGRGGVYQPLGAQRKATSRLLLGDLQRFARDNLDSSSIERPPCHALLQHFRVHGIGALPVNFDNAVPLESHVCMRAGP